MPGFASTKCRHELRALVLDLDQTFLESPAGDDREAAPGGLARPGEKRIGSVSMPSWASAARASATVAFRRLTLRSWRRRLEGRDLATPGDAIGLDQMRRHPLLHVEARPVGLIGVRQRVALSIWRGAPAARPRRAELGR